MTDIFLSYAREDMDFAAALVSALKEAEYSVWFDNYTPTASQWEDIIERELERARCVLMLWSDHSMASAWVRKEGMVGLDRAVLVPVRISQSAIPDGFESIQFADLTSWNGSPRDPIFTELLHSINHQMLPRCQLSFDSLLQLSPDSLKMLYDSYFNAAARLGCVPVLGRFSLPKSPEEKRRLHRVVASLQISIDWDSTLTTWYANSARQKAFIDRVERLEHHIPLLWLRMLMHYGPFFSSLGSLKTHKNFLRFASIMFFYEMFHAARSEGHRVDIPTPLTEAILEYPRWEGCISSVFKWPDEIAVAYVTHIDDFRLPEEELIYGPKTNSQYAYGRSIHYTSGLYHGSTNAFPFTDPVWLEQYLIPQREIRSALEGSFQHLDYRGNAIIRKITDLNGDDLQPLYD